MLSAGVIETLPIFAKCPKIKETNKQPPVVVSEKFLNLKEPTITPKIAAIAKTQKTRGKNYVRQTQFLLLLKELQDLLQKV